MKGLIIKDILNLRKSFKSTLLMLGFFTVFAYGTSNPSYIISMVVLVLTMMPITSMVYDDMSKWDGYALAMPISRKDIIKSKYLLSLVLSIISIVISSAIANLLILPRSNMSKIELLLVTYVVFAISILFVSANLPLIYKFGVEKSRQLMIGVFALPAAIFFIFNEMGVPMPDKNQLMTLLKISPFILIMVLFISSTIAYRIYKNKDI